MRLTLFEVNTDEDLKKFLRQISVSTMLEWIHKYSIAAYTKTDMQDLFKHIIARDEKTGKIIENDIIIQPWQFADLAYYSILYSNDFRGIKELNDEMFLSILGIMNNFMETKTIPLIENLNTPLDSSLYLYGFGGEQFKYQTKFMSYHKLIRLLYLIFTVSKKINSNINPSVIIKEEIGIEWEQLIKVLFSIYLNSFIDQHVNATLKNISSNDNKYEIFEKVIEYYSIDFDEIRTNKLGRQIFYTKPFVRTQKNELLSISVFLNSFIVEQAPFWIIRNYYQKQPKKLRQSFTDEFGKWFEFYFNEVCDYFKIQHEKIPENKKESADWKLVIGNHIFLIEQKSSVAALSIKQQLPNISDYKELMRRTVFKAIKQLYETENDLKVNNPIKIILCYDDYIEPNILPHFFEDNECTIKNDGRFFIANIIEMEMFLELATTDSALFEKVIGDMLDRNIKSNEKGLSLFKIMRDNGFSNNSYWISPIFDEYKNLLKDIKNNHMCFKHII